MRKKHPEHVNLERWLVSYADFITLLFAFFVILYATSKADMAKFKIVAASIRQAFAGPAGMIDTGGSSGGTTANPFEMEEIPGGHTINLPAGKTNTATDPDPELQSLKELLEESITLELGATDVSEKLQMQYDSRGLVVRL
ncbi:MAG: flagellar motor protein MotB, partial [Bdellovibrionota bacterium]